MLEFYPALHEYRDGDSVIPSVTRILKLAGYIDYRWGSREAMERGSAVHELCERYARGEREDSSGRRLEGLEYVNGFAAWTAAFGVWVIEAEKIIDHSIDGYRYAGKFDLLADIGGQSVLVDIKTGQVAAWHIIQIAAYCLAVKPARAAILYLESAGKYRMHYLSPREMLGGIDNFKRALREARQREACEREEVLPAGKKSWF